MAQLKIPEQPTEKITKYADLLGVDYQNDLTEIDKRRSPDMVNMISDLGGNPVKRYGWRMAQSPSLVPKAGATYDEIAYYDVRGITNSFTADGKVKQFAFVEFLPRFTPPLYGHSTYVEFREVNKREDSEVITFDTNSIFSNVNSYLLGVHQHLPTGRHYSSFSEVIYMFSSNENIYVITSGGGIMVSTIDGSYEIFTITEPFANDTTLFKDIKLAPLIAISLKPDGTGGETEGMEGKNLFTLWQQVSYVADGTSTTYKIPYCTKCLSKIKVEVMNSNGTWETKSLTTDYTTTASETMVSKTREEYYDVLLGDAFDYSTHNDLISNEIVFTSAPSTPPITGQDNVRITYMPFSTDILGTTTSETPTTIYRGFYNKKLLDILRRRGEGSLSPYPYKEYGDTMLFDGRLYISTNNHIYYSRLNNLFKIDDNGYFDVDGKVSQLTSYNSNIVTITKDSGNSTIFISSGSYNETTKQVAFSTKATHAGVGATTNMCKGTFNDEPVFMSKSGLYGIGTNYLSQNYAINRTGKINKKLDTEEAVGISFNGYYYISSGNTMYVLDGRHRDQSKNGDNSYECYKFDNMPYISGFYIIDEKLYFLDNHSQLNTFNEDLDAKYHYLDGLTWDTDASYSTQDGWTGGTPVKCKWCSKWDDDNYPQYLKSLSKKGTLVTIDSGTNTTCDVTLCKDGTEEIYLGTWDAGKFKYSDVALDAFTRKKVKKYKRLQIKVENTEAEPFGLTSVVKTYTIGNYAKR